MKKINLILLISGLLAGCSGSGDTIDPQPPQAKCAIPTNLKFQQGYNLFSWSDNSGQNSGYYEVEFGDKGFALGSGTKVEVSNTSYSAALYKNSTYDFYVRKNCGTANGVSNWAGPITILANNTTGCIKPGYANYTKTTSSVYSSIFEATISWENDGISVYEVSLTTTPTPPAPGTGDFVIAGQNATYTGLSKMITYNFFVRKRCTDNSFTDYYGPYKIKWE
ncbi:MULTISPECIES: hypothetical protein [unclassified Chryseobacterium]|uniref:hypothetical protein n=1 Tax=unclassified Chryseobacterium TaxID=2593645 RepID=UPI0011CD62F8|nr:hypothetical protein [Chryseobacterium sp. G0240]